MAVKMMGWLTHRHHEEAEVGSGEVQEVEDLPRTHKSPSSIL